MSAPDVACAACELPCRADEWWVTAGLCAICRATSRTTLRVVRGRLERELVANRDGYRRAEPDEARARRLRRGEQLAARLQAVERRLTNLNGGGNG